MNTVREVIIDAMRDWINDRMWEYGLSGDPDVQAESLFTALDAVVPPECLPLVLQALSQTLPPLAIPEPPTYRSWEEVRKVAQQEPEFDHMRRADRPAEHPNCAACGTDHEEPEFESAPSEQGPTDKLDLLRQAIALLAEALDTTF